MVAIKNKWAKESANFLKGTTILEATLAQAADALTKLLKPDRELISAISVRRGKLTEIADMTDIAPFPEAKAVTVARPTGGCLPTDFDPAELKARDVLRVFLSDQQLTDFNRYNKFVAVGADTGTRYMITSRRARDELARYQRSFYDLDKGLALCMHDWAVPPAEEMLALMVCVTLPGRETQLLNVGHEG